MNQHKANDLQKIYLKPGELFVDGKPAIVQTILGSCVSVTMYCTKGMYGAICHAMLPTGGSDTTARYVDAAIHTLIERMQQFGSRREWIEVKLFGGSSMIFAPNNERVGVGEKNINRAKEILEKLQLPLAAEDTGGILSRRLIFNSFTGEVFVRKVRKCLAVVDDAIMDNR